jgi:hypothetical protein
MADRSILFSGPMVRALLDHRKFQTRRVIDFPGIDKVIDFVRVAFDKKTGAPVYEMKDATGQFLTRPAGKSFVDYHYSPRFAVSDRLYVREAWRSAAPLDDTSPSEMDDLLFPPLRYEADGQVENWREWRGHDVGRFRQGMHMPRWASRLTLTVTDVRAQRLQEISEADAIAEGLEHDIDGDVDGHGRHVVIESWRGADFLPWNRDPVEAYADLWDRLNYDRGFGWDANPWVIAVTFTVERRNIDQVQQ